MSHGYGAPGAGAEDCITNARRFWQAELGSLPRSRPACDHELCGRAWTRCTCILTCWSSLMQWLPCSSATSCANPGLLLAGGFRLCRLCCLFCMYGLFVLVFLCHIVCVCVFPCCIAQGALVSDSYCRPFFFCGTLSIANR